MKKEHKTVLVICALSFALGVVFGVVSTAYSFVELSNKWLSVSEYVVESAEIPENFDGFRIVQVSDLHNTELGDDNKTLISEIKKAEPDIIVITGDVVDRRSTDIDVALTFVKKAVKIAPVYYVTGNHEASLGTKDRESLISGLRELGVTLLENESAVIEREGQRIKIAGLFDPVENPDFETSLKSLVNESEDYTVLLSHRPELFETYVESGANLVFSGHAHGGQFILPGIGGLFAPGQGILPEYYEGVHTENGCSMVVSRGLGNSAFPLRFNNRPELVVVELACAD